MITIKLPIQNKIDITNYLNQYNNVVRFAYNRHQDNKELKLKDVEKIVKTTMNNIDLLDASLIKSACEKALYIKDDNIIFGGKNNWKRYIKRLITKEEFKEKRNLSLQVRGSKLTSFGNRKFQLDIINNNQIIFKPNRRNHIICQLSELNKNYKKQLYKLEELCFNKETFFTCSIDNKYVYISFDETILKEEKTYTKKENRILSIDLNPNHIAYSICDYNEKDRTNILHKEIISLKEINDLEKQNNYKNSDNKKELRKHFNNKRRHEIFEISKRIINIAKSYNVESLIVEKLNIKSSDKEKGKNFNKLCNNQWLRNSFIDNLRKRCNINEIIFQEVLAQYSSFIGQMNNETEFDSIAASLELGRRGNLYIRRYIKKEHKNKVEIVFPEFNIRNLSNRWKEEINSLGLIFKGWKDFYSYVKKSKFSYRFLFDKNKIKEFFRLNSIKSYVIIYKI